MIKFPVEGSTEIANLYFVLAGRIGQSRIESICGGLVVIQIHGSTSVVTIGRYAGVRVLDPGIIDNKIST